MRLLASVCLFLGSPAVAGEKVEICHLPPGQPEAFHTLMVSQSALKAHMDHDDMHDSCAYYGEELCDDDNVCTAEDGFEPGTEACVPEDLRPRLDCYDGVACTVDDCDPLEGCDNWPDDASCPEGERCDPEAGCGNWTWVSYDDVARGTVSLGDNNILAVGQSFSVAETFWAGSVGMAVSNRDGATGTIQYMLYGASGDAPSGMLGSTAPIDVSTLPTEQPWEFGPFRVPLTSPVLLQAGNTYVLLVRETGVDDPYVSLGFDGFQQGYAGGTGGWFHHIWPTTYKVQSWDVGFVVHGVKP